MSSSSFKQIFRQSKKKFTKSTEFRSKNEIEWTLTYQNVLVPTDTKYFDTMSKIFKYI